MFNERGENVGRFAVSVELDNYGDFLRAESGELAESQVRRLRVDAVVDSGASRLVLPTRIAEQLGLPHLADTEVRYADGRRARRATVHAVRLTYAGRSGSFSAILEPDRDSVLLGAIVLEDLDLIVDCAKKLLVPRDPDHIISEIE